MICTQLIIGLLSCSCVTFPCQSERFESLVRPRALTPWRTPTVTISLSSFCCLIIILSPTFSPRYGFQCLSALLCFFFSFLGGLDSATFDWTSTI
ncbi:hypothetical protein BDV95DRAFT_131440 [Massariosphaeria phaeospora]|uniref:Uncharacterized protein n=1 Tax=Massariosphaeria phaeospora TaxID=100035 RepID=A0A7C8I1Q4_9PLEO|nr:hypothetical protein BDV95DRAFT_131440 [Massariosphaeria phaeospora]